MAGCQAAWSTARTAARTRSSAGRLIEKRMPRWRRWLTKVGVAPALSARTKTGWSRAAPGQLREREVKDLDVVGGGIGPGVAGPQHPGQCLPGAIAAVQVAGQRMNP
jgi:hypothetical protein